MAAKRVSSLSLEEAIKERAQVHDQINELREYKIELTKHIALKENEEEAARSAGFGITIGIGDQG